MSVQLHSHLKLLLKAAIDKFDACHGKHLKTITWTPMTKRPNLQPGSEQDVQH